jgi:hypothetical protein
MNYTFYNILSTETIGDSLSSININYANLDDWTNNIQFSANNYWLPLVNFFENVAINWSNNILNVTNNKSNWDSNVSIVNSNSSKWISPLVLMYPYPLTSSSYQNNVNDLTNWVNNNYSCFSDNGVTYIDGQKSYVYALSSTTTNYQKALQKIIYGSCQTTPKIHVCASCKTAYYGTANCSNGDMICDGKAVTCNECQDALCEYPQTGSYQYNPAIEAWLTTNYNDIGEARDLLCLKFQVSACQWTFLNSISSNISTT